MERLASVGLIRNGVLHGHGVKSHARVRQSLGDKNSWVSQLADNEGFITSEGRFVDRIEAQVIALESGQTTVAGRKMLSSDITW